MRRQRGCDRAAAVGPDQISRSRARRRAVLRPTSLGGGLGATAPSSAAEPQVDHRRALATARRRDDDAPRPIAKRRRKRRAAARRRLRHQRGVRAEPPPHSLRERVGASSFVSRAGEPRRDRVRRPSRTSRSASVERVVPRRRLEPAPADAPERLDDAVARAQRSGTRSGPGRRASPRRPRGGCARGCARPCPRASSPRCCSRPGRGRRPSARSGSPTAAPRSGTRVEVSAPTGQSSMTLPEKRPRYGSSSNVAITVRAPRFARDQLAVLGDVLGEARAAVAEDAALAVERDRAARSAAASRTSASGTSCASLPGP